MLRPYDPDGDAAALWSLKRAFETDLAAGDDEKAARYADKLTDGYRERYLAWARECTDRESGCIRLAFPDGADATDDAPVGYAFVLPEAFAHVWDAAVLNELYLAPDHRGSGLADDLMDAALAHARGQELPMDRMVLDVDPGNARAYAFYERRGFEPWAEMVAREL